jgi:DNA-binding transcriptional MerR regulator
MIHFFEGHDLQNPGGLERPCDDGLYLIGELSTAVNLEPKTIRFYEKIGLVSSKRHGRIRIYREKDVDRLRAIRYLRSIELPIAKIREIISLHNNLTMEIVASPEVKKILADHMGEMTNKFNRVKQQIEEIT